MISSHSTWFFLTPCLMQEIRRFGLTVAAVGILKTIDDDIPVLLKACTTLKSDVMYIS